MRRPAPATVIATIALVLASAPAVSAADGWVTRALYARNAGTVDGFSASKTPKKGKLVVLPKSGKLPASILPASVAGTTASTGSTGSAGTAAAGTGGPAFLGNATAAVTLAAAQTPIETLTLKPGTYAIVAKLSLHVTTDISSPGVTCQLKAGTSDGDTTDVDLTSSSDNPVALITTHTFAAAGPVTLTCAADDTGVVASDAHILALSAASVTSS
jgi:hypothetical protein